MSEAARAPQAGLALRDAYCRVRNESEQLVAGLSPEDQTVQVMEDASRGKWHLAHTTWFFETLILRRASEGYRPFDEAYAYLFNSYYQALGPRHPRPARGLLTRPSVAELLGYRRYVDDAIASLLESEALRPDPKIVKLLVLVLNHEQQ